MATEVRKDTALETEIQTLPGAVTVKTVTVTRSTETKPRTFIVTTSPVGADTAMGTVTKTITRKVIATGTPNLETVEKSETTTPPPTSPSGSAHMAIMETGNIAKTASGITMGTEEETPGLLAETEAKVTTRRTTSTTVQHNASTSPDVSETVAKTPGATSITAGTASETTVAIPIAMLWTSATRETTLGTVTKVTSETVTRETKSSSEVSTGPQLETEMQIKIAPEMIVKAEAHSTSEASPGSNRASDTTGAPQMNGTTSAVETLEPVKSTGLTQAPDTMTPPSIIETVTVTKATVPYDDRARGLSKMEFCSFLFRKHRVRGRSLKPPPPRPISMSPSASPRVPPRSPPASGAPDSVDTACTAVLLQPLEAVPTTREVIDHRSKTVEQILEILKKGTQLWKIRSFTKWYRRTYYLDDKEGTVRYEPSHKAPCVHTPLKIVVDDIIDVRKGWKTDTFNKIEKKVERRKLKFPSQPSPVDERCCFSIIYSSNKQSLDLLAPEPKIADMWVRGLRHIVTVLKGLHQEERFERWLEQQFREADVDNNNGLNFEESLKLLKQLNVKMPRNSVKNLFDEANTVKHTRNGQQVLDADEFVLFYMKLMTRNDIRDIYIRYAKNNKEMTADDLMDFIHKEQKGHTTTKEECLSLIEAFEQSNLKIENKLSLIGFTNMLMSEQFDAFKQQHKVVYQNMYQPLSHYYIATSHNTYLTGKQLHGESSVEGYIDALKQGCRCVELDCWDGPDGEPIIYHGYTLTSKILFKDVLVDAIKPYAFRVSEYPIILSLENHLSAKQQEVLTKHLIEILGDMLYIDPVDESWEYLPSPEALKNKIVIKAKKKVSSRNADNVDGGDSSTEDEAEPPPGAAADCKELKGKREVSHALSNLVNVCEAVHFSSFEDTEAKKKCYQMSSFSEAKANKFIETKGLEFVKYNTKHLSRIYPAGTRTDSSNFKPTPYWNVGCQLVALNYQHAAKPMLYNDAKFDDNGGCGYVLKPEVLRRNSPFNPESTENDRKQVTLKLTVISGQHIPKADNDAEGEIVDPYVKVKIIGHPRDNQKFKTEAVRNNGFNPRWDHEMLFHIKMPDFAIIHFIVKDLSSTGKDVTLGTYAIPFNSLQEGYSHVYLKDYERNFVSPASLFIHAVII